MEPRTARVNLRMTGFTVPGLGFGVLAMLARVRTGVLGVVGIKEDAFVGFPARKKGVFPLKCFRAA